MKRILRRVPILLIVALIVSFAVTASGCLPKQQGDLEKIVQKYNRLLPIAFQKSNAEDMASTATEIELHRIQGFIDYQIQQEKPIRAKLEKLKITDVIEAKDKGTVTTREWWLYRHENKQNAAEKTTKIYYEMRYDLIKRGNAWLVDRLTVLSQKTE